MTKAAYRGMGLFELMVIIDDKSPSRLGSIAASSKSDQRRELRTHIINYKHLSDRANQKRCKAFQLQVSPE